MFSRMSSPVLIIPFFFTFLLYSMCLSKPLGNDSDYSALLSFKSRIASDPLNIMASWNDSTHFCSWIGIVCGHRHRDRIVNIHLSSNALKGSLSPSVGNMSFLRELYLDSNHFTGEIPEELGRLSRLRILELANNSFSGEIPRNISRCSNLRAIDLGGNELVGTFPVEFEALQKLEILFIYDNRFLGGIPHHLGNLSLVMRRIDISMNDFDGNIPETLNKLWNLQYLLLYLNNLSGVIPTSLFNMSSLIYFDLGLNQFQGYLPSYLGSTLPRLEYFDVGGNQLKGQLPVSISNATGLTKFAVTLNHFTGGVPSFEGLNHLQLLGLDKNPLGDGNSHNLDFFSYLQNSSQIEVLLLEYCNFGGIIPEYIGNFTNLSVLKMGKNQLHGKIPVEIGALIKLQTLTLEKNQLDGVIPSSIGKLRSLYMLSLGDNQLSGEIPSSLQNSTLLSKFLLFSNNLHGLIPFGLGNCSFLTDLYLDDNNISGHIPKELFVHTSSLSHLDLSYNHLMGPLPSEVGNLKSLVQLDLSDNFLTGEIPSSLAQLTGLTDLTMSRNIFQGSISPSLRSLKSLETLDLSHNNFTGTIPEFLSELVYLRSLNLSHNYLEGEVPLKGIFRHVRNVSLGANTNLCGGVPALKLPKCTKKNIPHKRSLAHATKLAGLILCGIIGLILPVFLLICLWCRRNGKKHSILNSSTADAIPRISYDILNRATNGFSIENLIGSGHFSSVYKGILDDNGAIVAVKVLKLHVSGVLKSFMAECEALRHVRHRNLVKIITSCSSLDHQGNDFKALVYEYMVNGSLEIWLHHNYVMGNENHEAKSLDILQRLNISTDVANALDYLHHQSGTPLVHCDLKPSNVLLDNDLVAHVSDFGLAKILPEATHAHFSSQTISSAGIKGTIGYAAPEYGLGNALSTKGDVYSFGILLLEMFTGKRPTDDVFSNGIDIHSFVKRAIPGNVMEISDAKLFCDQDTIPTRSSHKHNRLNHEKVSECFISIFEVGIQCSKELSKERMDIKDACKKLSLIKNKLLEKKTNKGRFIGP